MEATPLENDLLRHRAFLLRLAAGLVGGNDADDLAQDVWLRALEQPRASRPGGRAWLAHVARNLAVNRFRARGRRGQRERDAARLEAIPGAPELEERLELGQELAAAVRALDEPYRTVILLRFFEGLSHASIAARLGLPLATVRTRQQRALARLRARLDRGPGGREAWSVMLSAWVAGHEPSATTGLASGLAAAAGLIAVGLGAWALSREPAGRAAPAALDHLLVQVPSPGTPELATTEMAARVPVSSASMTTPSARTLLVGRVAGLSPAELREAHIQADATWKRYAIDAPPVPGVLHEDGRFEIEVDGLLAFVEEPADELVAVLDHPLHLLASKAVAVQAGVPQPSGVVIFDAGAIVARDAAVVNGFVRLPNGTPAVGAAVVACLLDEGVPRSDSLGRTTCDAEGRFDLRLERGGECLLALLVEDVRPAGVIATPRLGRAIELGTSTLESGHAIQGRVTRLGSPMPLASVTVAARPSDRNLDGTGGSGIGWLNGRVEWTDRRLEADSEGRFSCRGLAAAGYSLAAHGAAGMGALGVRFATIEVTAPGTAVELEFLASLVTLERAPGSPPEVAGKVRVARAGGAPARFARDQLQTTFVAPPNTLLSLSVEFEGVAPIPLEIVTPGPGEELRRSVAFSEPGPLATLELEWIPDPRLSIRAFRAHLETPQGVEILQRRFYTGDSVDGIFRMQDVPPGRCRLRIRAGWDHLERTVALERVLSLEFAPGATTRQRFDFELGGLLCVDVRASSGERCAARFRLLDAAGEPMEMEFQTKREDIHLSETWLLSPWAEHTSETLPVGDYTLVLWHDGLAEQRIPVRIAAGATTALDVTLHPDPARR